jgi:hypothetical protein
MIKLLKALKNNTLPVPISYNSRAFPLVSLWVRRPVIAIKIVGDPIVVFRSTNSRFVVVPIRETTIEELTLLYELRRDT